MRCRDKDTIVEGKKINENSTRNTQWISKHTPGQCNLADKLFWKVVLAGAPPKCGVTWLAKEMRLMTGVELLTAGYSHTDVPTRTCLVRALAE